MSKTTYEVGVKYTMDDKASAGLASMARGAAKAENSMFTLRNAMVGLGFAAGAVALGKKVLIDYNSEIDSMKIGLTAVLQMQMHMPLMRARQEADGLFTSLQNIAKASPGTTKDFIEMATTIAPAVAAAGGSVKKIQDLAAGAVIAGKAMGIRADVAALDIKQMLAGTVSARDMLAQQMILAHGLDSQKFNAMSAGDRGRFVEKALTDPALKQAAKTYGESFEGTMSTAMDNFQIGMGKVGRPVMDAVAKALGEANRWIEENPQKLRQFVGEFGEGIRSAFNNIKGIFSWILDNRDTLLTIGKMFIAFKGVNLVANEIGAVNAGIKALSASFATAEGEAKAFGMGLGGVTLAIGLMTAAAIGFADYVDHAQDKTIDIEGKRMIAGLSLKDAADPMQDHNTVTRRNFTRAKDEGLLDAGGNMLPASAYSSFSQEYYKLLQNTVAEMHSFAMDMDTVAKSAGDVEGAFWRQTMGDMTGDGSFAGSPNFKGGVSGDWAGAPGPAKVNVTIQTIEVTSEDPDRFVFGAVKAFESVAKNPTQAEATITGGF